ncbi:hypothetical protein IYR97_22955 (plasmid) [Pseudomonas fulva]|uniref:hypothetical protein n=2 Tax=Pseudomonas fulva TaxID=47880 RepID=UPI0018ABE219|nr:hypothetical protein [Pseudomonas fulva]QPH46407.1 hypothetical protein IYR97_22955 [Pseudomonas fulva]
MMTNTSYSVRDEANDTDVEFKVVSKDDVVRMLVVWQSKGYERLLDTVRMFDEEDGGFFVGFMDYTNMDSGPVWVPEHMNRSYKTQQHALAAVGAMFDAVDKWNSLMNEVRQVVGKQ